MCFGKQWRIIRSPLRKNIDVTPPQKVPGGGKNPATTTREVQSQLKVIGCFLIVWLWSNLMWILRGISNYCVFIPVTQRELICTRQPGPKIMKLMRSIKAKLLGKGKNGIIYIGTEMSPSLFLPLCRLFLRFSSNLTGTQLKENSFFFTS